MVRTAWTPPPNFSWIFRHLTEKRLAPPPSQLSLALAVDCHVLEQRGLGGLAVGVVGLRRAGGRVRGLAEPHHPLLLPAPLVVAPPTYNIVDELKADGDWGILQKYAGFEFDDQNRDVKK